MMSDTSKRMLLASLIASAVATFGCGRHAASPNRAVHGASVAEEISVSGAERDSTIPQVEDDYRKIMEARIHLGKSINQIIPVYKIRRIVLLEDRLNAHWDTEPGFTADQAVQVLIEQTELAKDYTWLAEEGVVARLLIVDTAGEVLIVEALRHMSAPGKVATAFTVRGRGFGCRLEVRNSGFESQ